MDETVHIGTATLGFWDRIYPGLTKEQGELFIDAEIRLSSNFGLTASALRDQMITAGLEKLLLTIRYRDMDNRKWLTIFEVIREFWDHGLRIASVQQKRL